MILRRQEFGFEETGVKNTEVKPYVLTDRKACRKASYELADRRSSVPLDNTTQTRNRIEPQRITTQHRIIIKTRHQTFIMQFIIPNS